MKKNLFITIAIILMFVITMSGRWSRQEPKDISIATAFLYDKTDDGLFDITIEFLDLNPSAGSQSSSGSSQSIIKNFKGPTPADAIRDISIKMEKPLYGSQNRVRFFSEKFAMEEGLLDISDFFIRDHNVDERPYLMVVKNEDPTVVFEADIGTSDRLGDYVYQLAGKRQEMTLNTYFVNTLKFVCDYYTEGKQPVISVVQAVKNEADFKSPEDQSPPPKNELIFEGLGVMKDAKLVGYLDRNETRTYVMITEKVKAAFTSIPIEDKFIAVRINKLSPSIKTSIQGGKVKIAIDYKLNLLVTHNMSDYDITKKEDISVVEKIANKFFEDEMKKNIARVQKDYKSDIYGFGTYFHRQNHADWMRIKSQWDDKYFAEAEVNVKFDSNITYSGETREKFGENAK